MLRSGYADGGSTYVNSRLSYFEGNGWVDSGGYSLPLDIDYARNSMLAFTDGGSMVAALGTAGCITFAPCAGGIVTTGFVVGTLYGVTNSALQGSPSSSLWDTGIDWLANLSPRSLKFMSQVGAEAVKKTDAMDAVKKQSDDAIKKKF